MEDNLYLLGRGIKQQTEEIIFSTKSENYANNKIYRAIKNAKKHKCKKSRVSSTHKQSECCTWATRKQLDMSQSTDLKYSIKLVLTSAERISAILIKKSFSYDI